MAIKLPQIKLYTAHHCPYAHRAQIALRELDLTFTTVLVDIAVPRTPQYLAINSSGMVPTLEYDGCILSESGLICQFLADMHNERELVKASSDIGGALQRFQVAYFVEVFSKAHALFDAALYDQGSNEEKTMKAEDYIQAVVQNVEPLLKETAPFFGGAQRLTLAEVLTGPFVLRVLTLPKYERLVPGSVLTSLKERAPMFWAWAQAVAAERSVTAIWDEELVVTRTLKRLEQYRRV